MGEAQIIDAQELFDRGKREGVVETKLDQLIQSQRDTNNALMSIQSLLGTQTAAISRIETRQDSQQQELGKFDARLNLLEREKADAKDLAGVDDRLKAMDEKIEATNDRVDTTNGNFTNLLLKLLFAGATGGATTVGLGWAALKSMGILP